jgi:hypothetical protein
MALQLIYTSAPRLLQAGRTGFGTVAMHPGIPSWLQGEIERASQFSRVAGLDPTRVVLRHMIFGQGDRVHHVLSRILDSGADYTGRTNHIAHHFIFTAGEAAHATSQGVTPADAFAFLQSHGLWRTAWSEEPRQLGAEDILPVESIPKTLTLPAVNYWSAIVPDRPECAAILAPGKTSEACWIIYPPGWRDAIVYVMGESLALHANPWGVSFANDLQPTDNEQQIAWRGIPSDSPLLSKAQSSVRPCLDLTHPESLALQPLPEFVEEARTGKKTLPKSRAAAPVFTKALPETQQDPVPAIALLSKTNQRPRRNPYAMPLAVVIGLLVLLLVVGGGIFGYAFYTNKHRQQIAGVHEKILQSIPPNDNPPNLAGMENLQELDLLSQFLNQVSDQQIDSAEASLEKMRGFSVEWNAWRVYCNTLLDTAKKEKEKETLQELYSRVAESEQISLESRDQMSLLVKKHHAGDEEWQNVLAAIDFLENPDPKELTKWTQNPKMPVTTGSPNLIERVHDKINQIKKAEYNSKVAIIPDKSLFKKELESLLKDWPRGSDHHKLLSSYLGPKAVTSKDQYENANKNLFEKLGLKYPASESLQANLLTNSEKVWADNNSNSQIIYIIDNIDEKKTLIPTSDQGWSKLISDQISWNQLQSNSSIEYKIWGAKSSSVHFPTSNSDIEAIQFKVFKNNSPQDFIVSYTVLNRHHINSKANEFSKTDINALAKACNDYTQICRVEYNKLFLNDQFLEFLKSLFRQKNIKYQVAWSLRYKDNFYESLNYTKKIIDTNLDKIFMKLGDVNFVIKSEESQINNILETNNKSKKELNDKISALKEELSKSFPFSGEKFREWNEFVKATKAKIAIAKKAKIDVKDFEDVFLHNGARKIEDILNKYNEINDKNKFSSSLLRIDNDLKKWLFFDEEIWSEKSRENFKNQFNKDLFEKLNKEISNFEKDLEAIEKDKSMSERRSLLASRKSPQKATLNFYLEESDPDPFLTTEVTIPFPADSPTVVTTPPSTPVP